MYYVQPGALASSSAGGLAFLTKAFLTFQLIKN